MCATPDPALVAPPSPQSWGAWFELTDRAVWPSGYGIYRIRMSDACGRPVSLGRLCGVDPDGVIYVGRSGFLDGKTRRTLGQRLQEFHYKGSHSGAWSLWQARQVFEKRGLFRGHRLFASVLEVPTARKAEIDAAEMLALRAYFDVFGELPPFNCAFPGKWKTFETSL